MLWSLLTGSLALSAALAQTAEEYIASEKPIAIEGLLANIGEVAGADPGIVIASPSTDSPDYFYTWTRDSSLVFQAIIDQFTTGYESEFPESEITDFIAAQAEIQQVENPSGTVSTGGLGEPKFNVDKSAFTGAWGRPQRDGPALRASALITYGNYLIDSGDTDTVTDTIWPVVQLDLDYVAENWNQSGFDLWEEVQGSSFFTTAVQHKALRQGAAFADALGEDSATYESEADNVLCFLQSYWNPDAGFATANTGGGRSGIDANTVLTSIHSFDADAGCDANTFQPCSDRALSNLLVYVDSFRDVYTINSGIAEDEAVATGRYQEDSYYNGNPWYLTTIAVAEQLYDALTVWDQQGSLDVTDVSLDFFSLFSEDIEAGTYDSDSDEYADLTTAILAYADGFVEKVAEYTPEDGSLSEQYDKATGTPTSAPELTWSYAAALTAFAARDGFVPASWSASGLTVPTTCSTGGGGGGGGGATVEATFSVNAETAEGETVYVTGSVDALANWSPDNALELSSDDSTVWSATIDVPESTTIEYKYIKKNGDTVTWESDPNRSIDVGTDALSTDDTWQ